MRRIIYKLVILTAAVGLASLTSSQAQTVYQLANGNVVPAYQSGAKQAYFPVIAKFNHATNLLSLPNGDLLCVWYAGSGERDAGVGIAISRLNRGSDKWTVPVIVAAQPGWADQNPVLFHARNGKIFLFYNSQGHGTSEATAIVDEITSDDNGNTWTAPTPLFTHHGLYLRQPLVVFHHRWLWPMYQEESGGITSRAATQDHSLVQISKDEGKTWSSCEVPDSGGLVQMNIIKLSPASLIAFFRSRYADWIYTSTSTDGCHWSVPARTSLPNNNSSIQAVRLKDGDIVMAFNNAQARTTRSHPCEGSRVVLSVALSVDSGKTWPWIRDVQAGVAPPPFHHGEDEEYSYPSITQSPDGMIQMSFTFRKETIKYMSFDEQWIKRGDTVGIQEGVFNIY